MTGRCPGWPATLWLVAVGLAAPASGYAQQFTYRGFADAGLTIYPQPASNDSTQVIADGIFRFEPSVDFGRGMLLAASLEARGDTHHETIAGATFRDRTFERPAFAARTLAATFARGPLTVEIGKQFVRWGQSDILSPTDHFTARDYLVTVSNEAVATTAARVTVASSSMSLETVYAPRMTPSRMPLIEHRWIGTQAAESGLALQNAPSLFPRGPQYGARWHHLTRRVEYSATFFQGFHHLAALDVAIIPARASLVIRRRYPAIRAWGGDAVIPLPGITFKFETAWLQARRDDADDYGLWVIQGERQQGEWLLIGGYVGDWVSEDRNVLTFSPDRGLARSLIGRAAYTSGTSRSFMLETVARRNGDGFYAKAEYSHPLGAHWRTTWQLLVIRGNNGDFLGQYRRNSLTRARARFSF